MKSVIVVTGASSGFGALTARELAAAFSLQYDPKIDAGGSTSGVRGR